MKLRIWKKGAAPVLPVWEDIGLEVSVEGSVCQAAQAIDMAGRIATEQQDSGRLLEVGEYFTKLADFIVAFGDHKKKQDSEKKPDFKMGFQSNNEKEED